MNKIQSFKSHINKHKTNKYFIYQSWILLW